MSKADVARDSLAEVVELAQRSVDAIECAHLKQELMRRLRAERARAQEDHAPPR